MTMTALADIGVEVRKQPMVIALADGRPQDEIRQQSGDGVEVNRKTPWLWGTPTVITGTARMVAIDSGHGQ